MALDIEFKKLHSLVADACLLAGIKVVIESLHIVAVGSEGLKVILYGLVVVVHLVVFLSDIGIDASQLPSVGGCLEEIVDGFLALFHLAI